MHIKWIPTVEHVSEVSPHNNKQEKKALGSSRAAQQIGKLYQYKARNTTWKSATPAWAGYYSQRETVSYEFYFLTVSEKEEWKMTREWGYMLHKYCNILDLRCVQVHRHTDTHTRVCACARTRFTEIVKAVGCGQVLFSDFSPTHNLCSAIGPFHPEESLSQKPSTSYLLGLLDHVKEKKERLVSLM